MAQVATVYSIAPFPLGVRSLTSTAAGGTFATGAAAGSAVLLAKVVPVVLASTEAASLAIAASPRLVAVGQAIVNALSAEGAPTIISGVAAAGGAALRGPAGELIDEFGDDAARTLKGAGDELVDAARGVASGAMAQSGAMNVVRTVQHGEKIADLITEGKSLTFVRSRRVAPAVKHPAMRDANCKLSSKFPIRARWRGSTAVACWRSMSKPLAPLLLPLMYSCTSSPIQPIAPPSIENVESSPADRIEPAPRHTGRALPNDCDKVTQLSAGASFTCALFVSGRVICWGLNDAGELGQGDRQSRGELPGSLAKIPPIDFGNNEIASITSAGSHSCIVTKKGDVGCWGANDFGVLGLGRHSHRGDDAGEMGSEFSFVALGGLRTKALASGSAHVCALLEDASTKCWGWNDDGQLGQGDRRNRGTELKEMGDSLESVFLGAGRTAKILAAGATHTCAVLDDGSVKCWGSNHSGELGLGDAENRGDDPNEMGDLLPEVQLGPGRTAIGIAAGDQHTCALLDNNVVKCWGGGLAGALGRGDTRTIGTRAQEMGDRLPNVNLGSQSTPVNVVSSGLRTCAVLVRRRTQMLGWK